jgi:phosphoribosylanthranilate isomerase
MVNALKVKICGVNAPAAFDAVVQAGADYLGFVFFERSPRFVTGAQAAALSARHVGGPQRVGLFVEPSLDEVAAVLAQVRLNVLQIYGSDAAVAEIRQAFGLPVWRALGVAGAGDLPVTGERADGFVVEAKPPPGATRPGGNAVCADWGLLGGWRTEKFWLLAGGLTPENVADALRESGAPGADVSSGVESAPGVKSEAAIARFVAAVRAAAG